MGYEATVRLFDPEKGLSYDLGTVNGISKTYSANVTQKSVVIYGYENALCLDTGVSKAYVLDFIRVSPYPPNATSQVDTSKWSNARWLASLKNSLNRWQVDSDGFRFSLTMDAEMQDLYPDINGENVYVTSISLPRSNASSQIISGSITLQVGSLTQSDVDLPDTAPLTFYSGYDTQSFYVAMPIGSEYTIPYPKASWTQEQTAKYSIFGKWTSGDTSYYPGDVITVSGAMDFTAQWNPGSATLVTSTSTFEVRETTSKIIAYLFGAGGGGGEGRGSSARAVYVGGGGGGGGGMDTVEIESPPTTLSIVIGAGGGSKEDGGDTYIDGYSGVGAGGRAGGSVSDSYDAVGAGGAGGASAESGYSGGNGGYATTNTYSPVAQAGGGTFGGQAGPADTSPTLGYAVGPGGGGGSVAVGTMESLFETLGISPSGGNGGGYATQGYTYATDGTYGCGGGGSHGPYTLTTIVPGASGGDGFAIILEFEE